MRFLLFDFFLMLVAVSGASGCDSDGGPVESQRRNAEAAAEPATDMPPEIAKVIEMRFASLRGCYEQALKRSPGLAAIFSMKFTVDRDGRADDIEILDPYFEHAALEHCFTAVFEHLRFPPLADGEPNTFVYPLRFEPPSRSSR